MCLDKGNQIKVPFESYQTRQVWRLVKEVPKERRESLAEELTVRANLLGCSNGNALKAAVKHLRKEV